MIALTSQQLHSMPDWWKPWYAGIMTVWAGTALCVICWACYRGWRQR